MVKTKTGGWGAKERKAETRRGWRVKARWAMSLKERRAKSKGARVVVVVVVIPYAVCVGTYLSIHC